MFHARDPRAGLVVGDTRMAPALGSGNGPWARRLRGAGWCGGGPVALAVLLALVSVLDEEPARGDAIPPPTRTCPAGSRPESCHGAEYCEPLVCTDDSECTGGATCQELALCIGQIICGGRWASIPTDTVEGPCERGSCAVGTCRRLRVCVSPGDAEGCGCSLAAASRDVWGIGWVLLGIAIAVWRRRFASGS